MMEMTTIVLADDHLIVRHGIRALLETEPGFQIVGEAGDGLEAVHLVESLKPNILITDLMMPRLSGLEATREVRDRAPATHVVILSMHSGQAYVMQAFRNGAYAYILKDSPITELVEAVRKAAHGQRHISNALAEQAIDALVEKAESTDKDPYDSLTTREREVLQMAAEGRNSGEIGEHLFISARTAETHRGNLMKKLSLHTQTDLVRYAIRRGILPLSE